MKKLLSIIICIMMVFSLIGCGAKEDNSKENNASESLEDSTKEQSSNSTESSAKNGDESSASADSSDKTQESSDNTNEELYAYTAPMIDVSAYEGKKLIAITVDDGPDGAGTAGYIEIAKEFNIPLTFFVIGQNIKGNENQLIEMLEAGCEIGNHSYTHAYLSGLDPKVIRKEIRDTNEAIASVIDGDVVSFVRAPYFSYNNQMSENIAYPMIDAALQESTTAEATLETLKGATDGDIVLLHTHQSTSREALREAIPYLIEQGFAFVTVSQLFEICNVEPSNGSVYKHVGRNIIQNYGKTVTVFEGEGFAAGDWNNWGAAVALEKDDLKTYVQDMTEKDAIMVEYTSLIAPCFILMDWNDGGPGWVQLTPSFEDGKHAIFTYADLFTAYGFGEDLSTVDGAEIRPWGADLTVTKIEFLSET